MDFILGKVALDIDGHEQDVEKNNMLARLGYTPLHLSNKETKDKKKIRKLLK